MLPPSFQMAAIYNISFNAVQPSWQSLLTVGIACSAAGQVHGLWLDLRKGVSGLSFECCPSVYLFGVF